MKNFSKQPIALALGAAFALSGAAAQASVFQTADLSAGYMVASAGEGKTGEHKCGEGKCGEGKCGAAKFDAMDTNKDGMLTKDEFMAAHKARKADGKKADGKCGEGKCGEGKCGGKK